MGVAEVYGREPQEIAREFLGSAAEVARKMEAKERRLVYEEETEEILRRKIAEWFDDSTVIEKTRKFAGLGTSQSLYRRIVNERARHVYSVPPTRTIDPAGDQERFAALAAEVGLNEVMNVVVHQLVNHNDVVTYTRYVPRLRRVVDQVLTPDMVTIIPDPDDVTVPLAFIYDRYTYNRITKKQEIWRVYWDDEITFLLDATGALTPFPGSDEPSAIRRHGLARMPFQLIRRWKPVGQMWNQSQGKSLLAANFLTALLRILGTRLLKAQGFNMLVVAGDIHGFPKGQLMVEDGAILAPDGTSVSNLQLKTDAQHYMDFAESIETSAAANHGISRQRLNKTGSQDSDDTGLMEERAELISVMEPAEIEHYEILKMVSLEHDDQDKRQNPDATMRISFGEWQHVVDEKTKLELWKEKRSMGVGNVYEQIKATYRDVTTDEEAKARLDENMAVEASFVEKRRALNMPDDATATAAGQDPEMNGRMGPEVRDGRMSKDQAADMARMPARERKRMANGS